MRLFPTNNIAFTSTWQVQCKLPFPSKPLCSPEWIWKQKKGGYIQYRLHLLTAWHMRKHPTQFLEVKQTLPPFSWGQRLRGCESFTIQNNSTYHYIKPMVSSLFNSLKGLYVYLYSGPFCLSINPYQNNPLYIVVPSLRCLRHCYCAI